MKRVVLLAFLLSLCVFLTRANAADLYVTNVTELYSAFDTAVNNDQDDVIHIASGVYDLTSTVKYNPYNTDPENHTLTIEGAGIGSTILDGGDIVQIMYIDTRTLSDDSQAHITIRGITFQDGTVTNESGAGLSFASNNGNITVENSSFINNVSAFYGGGLFARVEANGNIKLTNNVFYQNQANSGNGGGAAAYSLNGTNVTLISNTFIENSASGSGGGTFIVFFADLGTGNIYNNIIWNNAATNFGNDIMISNQEGNSANVYNNDFSDFDKSVPGSISEGNNINQDPLLTADFHLQENSPCINTGNNSAPGLPSTDFEGQSRIAGIAVDMGADEYHLQVDINNDGQVDISDVILVLRIALGLDPSAPCSNINGDSTVDISDVILTLRMALGLDLKQPCT